MSEHTPGPWVVPLEPYPHVRSIAHGCILARDWEPTEGDARLISAAPELLSALKRLEAMARILPNSMDEPGSPLAEAVAAINKAEGRSDV